MLKIDNSSSNLAYKGYVDKSLYKHIEKDFLSDVTKLRKKHYRFNNIPYFELNLLKMKKNEVDKNLKILEKIMSRDYDSKTYLLPVKETSKDGKENWQLKLANKLFPSVTVPLATKTTVYQPDSLLHGGALLESFINVLEDKRTLKNTESDLLKCWLEKQVKKHCSDSLYDKAIRKFITYRATQKAKHIDLKGLNIKSFIDCCIARSIERHNTNNKNKIDEKEFMNSLKF